MTGEQGKITFFQKQNILDTIKHGRFQWAVGRARGISNPLLRILTEKNPEGKIPEGRPCLRREGFVTRKHVESLNGGSDGK